MERRIGNVMRYVAGCLCSALLASLFTYSLAQPAANQVAAQESGPSLPGAPSGPSQTEPPELPPRRTFTPGPTPNTPRPILPRSPASSPPSQNAVPSTGSPVPPAGGLAPASGNAIPSLRPAPDPIFSDTQSSESPESRSPESRSDTAPPTLVPRRSDRKTPSGSPELPTAEPHESSPGYELTPDEAVSVAVYEQCNRGVVNITSKGLPGERFLFMEVPADGSGSGSIIDKQGHVLTNYHVIENAQQVEVALFDGSTFAAKFVGADPVNDLAVIKIDAPAEKLFPIETGDSSLLKVGMRVFAIGNPFGLERTMTVGIVSSLNRSLQIRGNRSIKAIIQTDAAVNPGNSGGPLLDSRGQLIGVNTAIATASSGQNAGVALAIPATLVSRVVPQLIRHGRVIRPEIGIQQVLETEEGLRIASLTPGGPAERAGLRGPQTIRRGPFITQVDRTVADLIVAVDGESVKTADDFLGLVERKRPGDTVVLSIVRGEQRTDVTVVLGGPNLEATPQPIPETPPM